MAYLLFQKNKEDLQGYFYRFYENQNDLNNSNINKDDYKIIEDSNLNFNLLKFGNKIPLSYNNVNNITYLDRNNISFLTKDSLLEYVNNIKPSIYDFIKSNPSHPSFNIWKSYYDQLNNLNLDTITYPLNKSLEQYFDDLGQPSFNILQLP
jgi:hypothetical protein